MSSVQINGLEELMRKLHAVSDNSDADITKALKVSGQVIRTAAVYLCPTDTGELKQSIKVAEKDAKTVTVGTNKEYAPYVEYGTGQRGDPSVEHRFDWVGQNPQPFLAPALMATKDEAVKQFANSIKKSIAKAVRR